MWMITKFLAIALVGCKLPLKKDILSSRKIPRAKTVALDSQTLRLLHDNGTLQPHHMTSRAGVMAGGMTLDDQQLMYKSAVYNSVPT